MPHLKVPQIVSDSTSILPSSAHTLCFDFIDKIQEGNFNTKMHVCRDITPGVIYEWKGLLGPGQFWKNGVEDRGKGVLTVLEEKDITFQAKILQWKDGLPSGLVEIKKVRKFYGESGTISRQKQEYIYKGNLKDCMKNGHGTLTLRTLYSNNEEQVLEMVGLWRNDEFIKGRIQDQDGTKEVNWQAEKQLEKCFSEKSLLKLPSKFKQNENYQMPAIKKKEKTKKTKKGMRISCTITELGSIPILQETINQASKQLQISPENPS